VYVRLATQKYLQFSQALVFGRNSSGALEMTLKSGLHAFSDLKEMKDLKVGCMAHRIGVVELEWMRTHWPKLQLLYDLFQELQDPAPSTKEWIKSNNLSRKQILHEWECDEEEEEGEMDKYLTDSEEGEDRYY